MVVLRYFFNLACFLAAFALTIWWLYKFSLDEDSVQFELKSIDFLDGYNPMLSFCLVDPFIESKLKKYNETLTAKEYKRIIRGNISYKGVVNINLDDVTLDLGDFYLGRTIRFKNGSKIDMLRPDFPQELPHLTIAGFSYAWFYKCYGLKTNFANIDMVTFHFNSSLYPDGKRPSNRTTIAVALHLPNQLLLSMSSQKYTWPQRDSKKEYSMDFMFQQIDILKRRRKRNDPCLPDELNFDDVILEEFLNKIGCKALYHRSITDLEVCDSENKTKMASFEQIKNKKHMKACTSASILTFTYNEIDFDWKGSEWFHVTLEYPDQYREIKMIQAIDLQTVIANAGGYIGMFLGKVI